MSAPNSIRSRARPPRRWRVRRGRANRDSQLLRAVRGPAAGFGRGGRNARTDRHPADSAADGQYVWNDRATRRTSTIRPIHIRAIILHPRDKLAYPNNKEKWHPYWKLSDGMTVKADQILCLLDDQLIMTKRDTAKEIRKASYAVHKQAGEGVELVRRKIELYKKNPDAIAEARRSTISHSSAAFSKISLRPTKPSPSRIRKWRSPRSPSGSTRSAAAWTASSATCCQASGRIRPAGEKIFEIQSTEKVRLEGNARQRVRTPAESQHGCERRAGHSQCAARDAHRGHRQEVSGLAVTGHAERPLVVSAGLDGFVLVWDPNLANAQARPRSRTTCRTRSRSGAVACTPAGGTAVLAITGADDGKVRIWDLTNPDEVADEPEVRAGRLPQRGSRPPIAVSPDGKYRRHAPRAARSSSGTS